MMGMALCQNIHGLYMEVVQRRVNRENQWKERVGLYTEMKDWSRSLKPSIQADEALSQWAEHYGKENNYIVTIGYQQFNLRNDVTMLKETLVPNQGTLWGIVSIIHELAELLQQRDKDRFIVLGSHIQKNIWKAAMMLAFTEDQKGLTRMEKNVIHMQNHQNFLQYCCQDGILLWPILDGILTDATRH